MSAAEGYPVLDGAEAYRAEGAESGPAARRSVGIGIIHGITGSPVSLRPLAEALAARGFRVDLPRLPGHGTHVRDMQRTRYADWRAEVVRTVDRLAEQATKVCLVGLSMGGTLSLDLASSDEPRIAAVVSINAQILDREGFAVKLAPLLERALPIVPAKLAGLRKDDIAKPGVSERAYDWMPTAAGNSMLRELPRIRDQLRKLRAPTLIAYSARDHSVPPENSRRILELAAAASPVELVLERSYHVATLDYDFEILVQRITEFFDSVAGSS